MVYSNPIAEIIANENRGSVFQNANVSKTFGAAIYNSFSK